MSQPSEPAANSFGWGDSAASPTDEGLSLDQLNQAFAQMLGTGDDPYTPAKDPEPTTPEAAPLEIEPPSHRDDDDTCAITPRNILEAMLFVGDANNEPLAAAKVAKLMRGVRPAEIDDLVQELNAEYIAQGRPYEILSIGEGYRLALRESFSAVRQLVFGKTRQHKLAPAALEVLSIVAYHGAVAADEVSKLRNTPSGSILAQLVRRQLLSVEKTDTKPRQLIYRTTRRFLDLFGLSSLDDLPRSQDIDKR
jgi:segregation and condensation protein B